MYAGISTNAANVSVIMVKRIYSSATCGLLQRMLTLIMSNLFKYILFVLLAIFSGFVLPTNNLGLKTRCASRKLHTYLKITTDVRIGSISSVSIVYKIGGVV